MQVSIIGTGNVGRALASTLTRAGADVTVTSRSADEARELAEETGAHTAETTEEAARAADVVILAVPATALDDVAAEAGDALAGKTVVDVTNRPTPNPAGGHTSIAEELQERLPRARVVKAFNTLFASRQADPVIGSIQADGFVAGDDPHAKQQVMSLLDAAGFRPVDAGPLAAARTLEGMAWLNISRNLDGGTWQDTWKLVGPEKE